MVAAFAVVEEGAEFVEELGVAHEGLACCWDITERADMLGLGICATEGASIRLKERS